MSEVKKRTHAITEIQKKVRSTSFPATNIEFCCLQLRKILELIAIGSLVANKKLFQAQKIKFEKFWHAERILNDIERFNPNFYPKPIKEIPSENPKLKSDFQNIEKGFLTKKEFIKVYEKCGKIMHADNPFGNKTNIEYYETQLTEWMNKITCLLNNHIITLVADSHLYLIHMQENNTESVKGYVFALVGPKEII